MKINRVIDALEDCKKILIEELTAVLKTKENRRIDNLFILLPKMTDTTYDTGPIASYDEVTCLFLDNDDQIFIQYEDYSDQYEHNIELFNVGEIAHIIDCLEEK